MKPLIAITMGDPAGVGPELCLHAMTHKRLREVCIPVVYGDRDIFDALIQRRELDFELLSTEDLADFEPPTHGGLMVHCGGPFSDELLNDHCPGKISALTGQASFNFVERAIADAVCGRVDAVVTCPIHKEAWNSAGIQFPGHTELFAQRAGATGYCMLMTAPTISCSLVTCHVGYLDVASQLTRQRILEVIVLTDEAMTRMRGRKPKLAVLGLNPHAGEHGLFGRGEEESVISPAIVAAQEQGINVEGPVPPDTAFLPWKRKQTDAYVCMYHDQGLIPFKALAFDTGVNTTLGLSMIRTSVDHGTALDIAWQDKVDPASLFAAVDLAIAQVGQQV